MSSFSQFNAADRSAAQRPASDVFRSSTTEQEHAIKSRFDSGGTFTVEQLETAEDLKELAGASGKSGSSQQDFDPNDSRSLYERLQANKEAKQEEFDARNTFKNQMDHWRLDEDEAAFEEERLQKLREQQQEATRLHEEGAEFYRLARAAQERPMQPHAAAPAPKASVASSSGAEKRKQKAQLMKPTFKVLKVQQSASDSAASAATASERACEAGASCQSKAIDTASILPGMGEYEDSSDEEESEPQPSSGK